MRPDVKEETVNRLNEEIRDEFGINPNEISIDNRINLLIFLQNGMGA
jgi:hypothetical protein